MIDLKDVITKYPESLESAARFRAYMADLYPERADQVRIKVLADVISCGIVDEIKAGKTDSLSISRYRKQMEDRYGYSGRLVAESIAKWMQAYAPSDVPTEQSPQQVAPAPMTFDIDTIHVHSFEDTNVPATCQERGYMLHRCKCGYERRDRFTPVGAHRFEVVDEIAPTCIEEGRRDYLCSVCSEYKSELIPEKDHQFGAWKVVQKAGCETEGRKERRCSTCSSRESEIIPAMQHDWSDWTNSVFATCTENGKMIRQCKRCKKIEEKTTSATGHRFSQWKDSTTQEGMVERYCENCGEVEYRDLAEEHRKRAEEELKKCKSRKKTFVIRTLAICVCIAFFIVLTTVIIPGEKLSKAKELIDLGDYDSALNLLNGLTYKDSEAQIDNCYIGKFGEEKWNEIKNLKVGDTYTFGTYEQDNSTSNGKDAIEWIVLVRNGFSIMVVSKYALDCLPYSRNTSNNTWEKCSLRKWLNDYFFNNAFNEDEQKMIADTNEVKDKVFCLSRTEEYLLSDEAKKCKPTEYCRSKGVDTYENGNCKWWWHRESGLQQEDTPVYSGATIWYRRYWIADKQAVRPALWINLDA